MPAGESRRAFRFAWSRGRMRSRLLLVLVSLAALTCARRAAVGESAPIIVISIDTLRSDRLPAYGYTKIATPAIDALRKDAVLFERAYSNCPLTLVAHASLFTGTMPADHGIRDNMGYRLAPNVKTLAEQLAAKGYATGGAVASAVLRGDSGIRRGFEFWDDAIDTDPDALSLGRAQRDGDSVREIAQKWIGAQKEKPFFFFFHIYEPHTPYEPTYDADVVASDAVVGRFLAFLREQDLYDRATILLLSDHGEGLGDHGEEEHGILLYRETLQVPLLVKLPKNERAGKSIATPVQLTDVLPTLVPNGAPTLFDAKDDRPLYAETYYPKLHFGWSDLHSIVRGPHHYIHGPKPELFDVVRDPAERANVLENNRRVYAALREQVTPLIRDAAAPSAIDPEQQRQLAALGYIGSTVSTKSGAALPDPKDHIGRVRDIGTTFRSFREQRYADTVQLTKELLAEYPQMVDLWAIQSLALERLGRFDDAIESAKQGLRVSPSTAGLALSIASLSLRRTRFEDAESHARLALPSMPAEAHKLLAEIALERKDFATARSEAQQAAPKQQPLLLGRIAQGEGRLDEALRHFDAAAAEGKSVPRLHFHRGDVLAALGRVEEAEAAFRREIALFPSDPAPYKNLIVLYAVQQRNEDATRVVFELEKASPTPPSYLAIAEVLRVIGDARGARYWAARGLEKFPGNHELRKAL
jgi:Flp pilus assembly protein TadD